MENMKISVKDNILTVIVDLSKEVGPSNSGRSIVVASSGGNLRLIDEGGYREERINATITRPLPKRASEADDVTWPDETVTTAIADAQSATESDNAQQ